MEQFFVGLLFGVIFSALFVLVGMLNRKIASKGWLPAWLIIEILLVVLAIYVLHGYWGELTGAWGKTHQWFHDYVRRPVHWFQFILGTLTGVLLRFWLVRLMAGYELTQVDRTKLSLASKDGGEGKPADFVSRERGWVIVLVGLLLLAVLLPQLENMARAMSSLKIAGVEVAFKDQKESNRLSLRPFHRESIYVNNLAMVTLDQVRTRLNSDDRSYAKADGRLIHGAATREYLNLFDTAIGPYMDCMAQLFQEGAEFETLRGWTRELTASWRAVAISNARETPKRLAELVSKSAGLVKKSGCRQEWKSSPGTSASIGREAADSLEFYRSLAATLQLVDNRITAIQLLESSRGRFPEQMNWHIQLALLYYEEDPTLGKSLEHYEAALRIAEANLTSAINAARKASISCPAPGQSSQIAKDLCYDQSRYLKAVGISQNGVAYVIAQIGDPRQLVRAIQLAAGQVRAARKSAEADPGTRITYLGNLDTLAFAVMANEAANPTPDAEAIACVATAFEYMADELRVDFKDSARKSGRSDFRADFVSRRFLYETARQHATTASLLHGDLVRTQGAARCPRAQLKKLLDGDY